MDEQSDVAALVKRRWDDSDRELLEVRRDYALNDSFYRGHQWVWSNDATRQLEDVRAQYDERGRERPKVTADLLGSRVENLLGRFMDSKLTFEALADSSESSVLEGARLAEWVIESTHDEQGWEDVREDEWLATILGGTAGVMFERTGRSKAAEVGVDDRTQNAYVGDDLTITSLAVDEFGLEPGSASVRAARWFVVARVLPPEQIQATYQLDWTPKADAYSSRSPLSRRLAGRVDERVPNLATLYVCYERPNPLCPEGRHIVCTSDRVVIDEGWPFPDRSRLNLVIQRFKRVRGHWYGTTPMNAARRQQAYYNMLKSIIAEHTDKAGNARLMVPIGSVESLEVFGDVAGETIPYNAQAGGAPGYMDPPQLARWLHNELGAIEQLVDDMLFTHAVSRGAVQLDRQSGLALSVAAEKNDTPLGRPAREHAAGWEQVASWHAQCYEQDKTTKREAKVEIGPGVPVTVHWTGDRLRGQTRFRVPLETAMPSSKAATQAALIQIKQAFPEQFANMDAGSLTRLLQLPNQREFSSVLDSDAACAQRENALMATGQVALPEKWHNHAKHIAEHNRYRNSPDFQFADQQTRDVFELHLQGHQQMIAEEMQAQAALNAIQPGMAAMPQAHNPIGSAVPVPVDEAQPPSMN